MKGHRQGGDTPTVLPSEQTHRGGTQPQCNATNGHNLSFGHTHDEQTKQTDKAIY